MADQDDVRKVSSGSDHVGGNTTGTREMGAALMPEHEPPGHGVAED